VRREDDVHDADDAALLRELTRLHAAGGDVVRERDIIAILIGGWEPIFKGWLVSRIGRQDGEEVGERIVVRLVELLVRERKLTAVWGACVWRIVRDEAYRYYRGREQSRERLVAEVYADPDTVPADDPLEELPLDPERDATRLTELVKELSERDQRVIELTIIEERPRPEAAALLGLRVNALNQARHRAVRNLAKLAASKGVSGGSGSDEEPA
jgi:DNA-directed RNA polymerase specialized sigma24 family protein